jgi:gluconate 2-dehydrogenase gamma chain
MKKTWDPKRRRFLEGVAAAAVLPAVSCSNAQSPWRCLTATEGETLGAICECLIPTDEYLGAKWAGAVQFIDIQLTGHYRKHRAAYREGLAAVDRASREKRGLSFVALDPPLQVQLLKLIEEGKAEGAWKPTAQQQFFSLVLTHTMQSYYGDPRHGGNRDWVGYRMLGLVAIPVRGRTKPAGG